MFLASGSKTEATPSIPGIMNTVLLLPTASSSVLPLPLSDGSRRTGLPASLSSPTVLIKYWMPKFGISSTPICVGAPEPSVLVGPDLSLLSKDSEISCSLANVRLRMSCGVRKTSNSRSRVCLISTAIIESIPNSASVE
uniref:Uncharacterized protein n=1 Tax=Cacopsylla melanoneura TaxID=428564 RepID=A0A8D8ZPV9_9HEMI